MKAINKVYAWSNVLIRVIIVDVILRVLAYIVFPIVFPFRRLVRKAIDIPVIKIPFTLLWIFLDDGEDKSGKEDFGNKLECWNVVGFEPTNWWKKFICAYYWSAIRNPVWNIYFIPFFKGVDDSPKTDVNIIYNYDLLYDNKDLSNGLLIQNKQDSSNLNMLRAKFFNIDNSVASPTSNEGDYLSLEDSMFGKKLYYFRQNNKWWVLYSSCFIKKIKKGELKIREINIGAASRILVRNKWQSCYISEI